MNKKIRNLWLETQNSKFKKPPILLLELKKASQSFMFFTPSKILLTFSLYTHLPNSHFTFSLSTFQISKHTFYIQAFNLFLSVCSRLQPQFANVNESMVPPPTETSALQNEKVCFRLKKKKNKKKKFMWDARAAASRPRPTWVWLPFSCTVCTCAS